MKKINFICIPQKKTFFIFFNIFKPCMHIVFQILFNRFCMPIYPPTLYVDTYLVQCARTTYIHFTNRLKIIECRKTFPLNLRYFTLITGFIYRGRVIGCIVRCPSLPVFWRTVNDPTSIVATCTNAQGTAPTDGVKLHPL